MRPRTGKWILLAAVGAIAAVVLAGARAELNARVALVHGESALVEADQTLGSVAKWAHKVEATPPMARQGDVKAADWEGDWREIANDLAGLQGEIRDLQPSLDRVARRMRARARWVFFDPSLSRKLRQMQAALGEYSQLVKLANAVVEPTSPLGKVVPRLPEWTKCLKAYSESIAMFPLPKICYVDVMEMIDRSDWDGIIARCDRDYPIAHNFAEATQDLYQHCHTDVLRGMKGVSEADAGLIDSLRRRAEAEKTGDDAGAEQAIADFMAWWKKWEAPVNFLWGGGAEKSQASGELTDFWTWYNNDVNTYVWILESRLRQARDRTKAPRAGKG
jgi:hypothetical protein